MIPAGTGIKDYRNLKLFDGADNDLDEQMVEVLERRRLEKESENPIEDIIPDTVSEED